MAYSEDYRKRVIDYRKEGRIQSSVNNYPAMGKEAEGRRYIKEKASETLI